jgi:hypothetical protein
MHASVVTTEPSYVTTPCRAVVAEVTIPSLMRPGDGVLVGGAFVRQALALGYRRVRINGETRRAADHRVRRVTGSRFMPPPGDQPDCRIEIEGSL